MFRPGFTPLSFRNYAHTLTIAMIAWSVIFGLLQPYSLYYFPFIPNLALYQLQLWRPLTALLIAPAPMMIIFGGLILYSIGSSLEYWLGRKRFLYVVLGIPLLAMGVTLLAALLMPSVVGQRPYCGASSIITVVWISYGLLSWSHGQTLHFWGIPLNGKTFALIGFGFVVLQGVFDGFASVFPELIASLLTYTYFDRKWSFNIFQKIDLLYCKWKLQRLKNKRGLKVVVSSRERHFDNDSNPQVH